MADRNREQEQVLNAQQDQKYHKGNQIKFVDTHCEFLPAVLDEAGVKVGAIECVLMGQVLRHAMQVGLFLVCRAVSVWSVCIYICMCIVFIIYTC